MTRNPIVPRIGPSSSDPLSLGVTPPQPPRTEAGRRLLALLGDHAPWFVDGSREREVGVILAVEAEAAGAALAALRDRIERVAQDLDDERGRRKGPGDGTLAAVVHTLRTLLATESGAAPAAGEE